MLYYCISTLKNDGQEPTENYKWRVFSITSPFAVLVGFDGCKRRSKSWKLNDLCIDKASRQKNFCKSVPSFFNVGII